MRIFISLSLTLVTVTSFAQKNSKLIHAFDNKLTMSIPEDVDTMSAAQLKAKYNKTPDGKSTFYGDADLSFSFVISPVTDGITEAEMVEHKKN